MMKRRSFLAALAGAASSTAFADDGAAADLFVFAGQSNIQVNANTTLENVPPYIVPDAGVRIWDCESNCFAVYQAGINSLQPVRGQVGGEPGNWGPEAEFSYQMRKAFPARELYIVKFGIGSSQLAASPRVVDWCPSSKGKLFDLTENAILNSTAELRRQGKTPRVRAIVWMQGESDAYEGGATAQNYLQNLTGWSTAARQRWGDDSTKLIIGKIFTLWGRTPADNEAVRSAQETVARSIPNSVVVSNDDAPHDGHFLPDGATKFGRDIFEAFTQMRS
jgi:Carbohydrate esterase, sialic acid-specific acetylesterase